MRALVSLLVFCLLAPVAPADEPSVSLGEAASFIAETSVLTSVKDLEEFAEGVYASKWDITKAARVENFVIEKDAGKWTLTGWIFLREPVRGIRNRAIFFGDGRFEMTPPIPMERQQAKRFLGTETVNKEIEQLYLAFVGASEQQHLESLTYTAEAAAKAEAENKKCKEWLEGVRKFMEKPETQQELERRRFREFELALRTYERVLDPRKPGWLSGDMQVKVPEGQNLVQSHLVAMTFTHSPDDRIETSLDVTFKHERGNATSRACEFHALGQHDGDLQWAGTSPFIEAEDADKFDFGVPRHVMKVTLTPGQKTDTHMLSEIDVDVLRDSVKAMIFGFNSFAKVKSIKINGKAVEFYQPAVPGRDDLRAPFFLSALPGKVAKGDRLKVEVESDSRIFEKADASTWLVRAELNWFPDPSPDLGDTPTVFDTTIRSPKGWTALANGRETPCADADVLPDMECARFVTNIGIDFATINVGHNMRADRGMSLKVDADKDGVEDPQIPIAVYTNATAKRTFPVVDPVTRTLIANRDYSLSENGPDAVGTAQIANKVYSEWFGPCPYDSLTITPHPKGHGRGSASLLAVSQEAFLSTTAFAELASLRKSTFQPWNMRWFLAHEVGHQWWGGAARIRDGALSQWFSEGFAQYGSMLVLEEFDRGGKTRWFWEGLSQDRAYLIKDDGRAHDIAPLAMGNRWASPENPTGYEWNRQDYMYGKGCLTMHALRMLARARMGGMEEGDALFKKAMRTFIGECAGKKAPSNLDLMRSLERTYEMPLDWFFKQWVFGLGIPKVEWSYRIEPGADGGSIVRGRVRQNQGGTPFQFPLGVSMFQGKTELGFGYQWIAKADSEFTLELPAGVRPDRITVNDDLGVMGIFKEVPWTAAASASGQ